MNDFFEYFKAFMSEFFGDIWRFIVQAFASPWYDVGGNFSRYNEIFQLYYQGFGVWGWILFVLTMICLAGIFALIIFVIVLLLKKYIRFYKKEVDKDHLVEEVSRLNYELIRSTNEKDRILSLSAGSLTGPIDYKIDGEENIDDGVRFAKLTNVDSNYKDYDATTEMHESDMLSLEEIVKRFRYFAASQLGLFYEEKMLRAFFAGLGTTKIIILEGISGTGKTSLPYALGKFIQNDAKICSVQPSWRDRSELLGYYNEFTKKFNETDFLRAIYEATYRDDINIVILDEMNLARIEYYFAEFLSIMEMPNISEWNIELISTANDETDPKHFKDGKLLIPQNVWFIGTANNDDSTFTITDKVYDRAISIFFSDKGKPFDCEYQEAMNLRYEYLKNLFDEAKTNYPLSGKMLEKFDKLDDFVIKNFKLAFGNRIQKQLLAFIPIYVACGGTELEGLDFIFATKILKKFEVLNIAFLKQELRELVNEINKLFGKNSFIESKEFIENLIKMN